MKSTAIANSNIAFVKYWGKKEESLNIPMNPSISMTLDEKVSTKTTIEFSERYNEDEFTLDNKNMIGEKLQRVTKFLDIAREKASSKLKARIVSVNSFPMGSGIASSASGFAALAAASTKALGLKLSDSDLSALARRGSGSAARSIHGGFVEWNDEYANQIKNESHWPELRDIIVLLTKEEKKVSSREGMRLTVETSELYKKRISSINMILFKVRRAIINKDFPGLMESIMKDSDNLHECMADTKPRLVYLNEDSIKIKKIVKTLNTKVVKVGYTFDAGSNAHIITLDKYVEEILHLMKQFDCNKIVSGVGKGITYTEEHLF
jgi:diphosphomevalonate decarboxylase